MAGKALMKAMATSSAQEGPGDMIREMRNNMKRKKAVLDSGGGKYAAPVRYAIRQGVKKIGDKLEDVGGKFKNALAMKRAKEDASGPTARNKSVGVCTAGGKCQN
jgi:hypothetical protein